MTIKTRTLTKFALSVSLFMIAVWAFLGTATSLAWFTDTTPATRNTFDIGVLDLEVSYKVDGKYLPVDENTAVFDDSALYEPGYVQVVYLRIENKGEIDFDYRLSVTVDNTVDGMNELGKVIHLPDYLKFGAIFSDSEAELDRELAKQYALYDLANYSQRGELDANETQDSAVYVALVVHMPKSVDNAANYRNGLAPSIDLGIKVFASQKGTIDKIPE
ncbi:MAG: hypothetical protein IJZ03_01915 [Clostridia bacterium]|nr:hypothetical protein [Clostridia bacterium]